MLIAQISDTHILAPSSDVPAGPQRAGSLLACVADINRRGVDAVIHTGDSVQNGEPEEYAFLREILSDLEAPYFLVPGNRDRRDALQSAFGDLDYLPAEGDAVQYAVEDFPLRLVGLDSVSTGERKGVFTADRLAWLDETLAQAPERPTVLFMHHPPFDVVQAGYTGGYRNRQDAEDLTTVVGRHPQVRRLLCGHVHCLHREDGWAGTVATTMPSVAVDVRKGVDAFVGEAPVYLLHTVSGNGDLDTAMQIAAG